MIAFKSIAKAEEKSLKPSSPVWDFVSEEIRMDTDHDDIDEFFWKRMIMKKKIDHK